MDTLINDEWYEILDPKSKKRVFVNTLSGKSQLLPPNKFQKITDNQWWELYDFKLCHFYYYNRQTKLKTWEKPNSKNIISLVKFQILQNRKAKKFIDQISQTNVENLLLSDKSSDNTTIKSARPSDKSKDNLPMSGTNNQVIITISGPTNESKSSTNTKSPELSAPLYSASGKATSRRKSSLDRKTKINNRLSHPIMDVDREYATLDGEIELNYLSNINDGINYDLESPKSFRSNLFPRDSVINALRPTVSVNTEMWSRSLFNKFDKEMAGIMSWTKKSIQDSILAATPKSFKKKACKNFKQIQMYMGDRESEIIKEILALKICQRGASSAQWANEIFMQLCKQVTHNPNSERTYNGWDLICICLMFFHPDSLEMKKGFQSFIDQYACFDRKIDDSNFVSKSILCARISRKLLDKSNKVSNITLEKVREAMKSYTMSTVFFSPLTEVMEVQKRFYPHLKLPWIQVALTREILRCTGPQSHGIFRVSSERSKTELMMAEIEKVFKSDPIFDVNTVSNPKECDPLLEKILADLQLSHDPILLSGLLRFWLMHISSPIMPIDVSKESLFDIAQDYTKILQKLDTLPEVNRLVLKYFIYLLQELTRPDNVKFTEMTIDNLVSLMAATIFKSELSQLQATMHILFNLINNLDTTDMGNVYG